MIVYQATISGANLILKRDPHGGSSRQGRVRRGSRHAAYRHVRACRL